MTSSVDDKRREFDRMLDRTVSILDNGWPIDIIPLVYTTHTSALSSHNYPTMPDRTTNAASLRRFVCHLLRRSRSSITVFATALCYLEAVQTEVFNTLCSDNWYEIEPTATDRIMVATNTSEIEPETTYLVEETNDNQRNQFFQSPVSPLSLLPSPLLCPRRTFLATVILAMKFLHDGAHSNSEWAHLCRLTPREVSTCERVVGNALHWRLWVGKSHPLSDVTPALSV
ncbi:MAG: hypothetical protein NXY57DRAFT_959935 [Lentinula lateritia]|nr:MAG: hypothetical protein NXY57DRAFT_959935 [Lentinula lateritia]